MKIRQLGFSDLHLTTIGLGAWAIGGDWAYGWGLRTMHIRSAQSGMPWKRGSTGSTRLRSTVSDTPRGL